MALYNTPADIANTAIRAFLTSLGEYYWGSGFNTGNGKGKRDWEKIRDEIFQNECAYCGDKENKLQMEHLIMFNRSEYGLHHPGNIVPVCSKCNSRTKKADSGYNTWEEHLSHICERDNQKEKFFDRWTKIRRHINEGEFAYPKLTIEEKDSIRIITNHLYEKIKSEFQNALILYKELDKTFAKK